MAWPCAEAEQPQRAPLQRAERWACHAAASRIHTCGQLLLVRQHGGQHELGHAPRPARRASPSPAGPRESSPGTRRAGGRRWSQRAGPASPPGAVVSASRQRARRADDQHLRLRSAPPRPRPSRPPTSRTPAGRPAAISAAAGAATGGPPPALPRRAVTRARPSCVEDGGDRLERGLGIDRRGQFALDRLDVLGLVEHRIELEAGITSHAVAIAEHDVAGPHLGVGAGHGHVEVGQLHVHRRAGGGAAAEHRHPHGGDVGVVAVAAVGDDAGQPVQLGGSGRCCRPAGCRRWRRRRSPARRRGPASG